MHIELHAWRFQDHAEPDGGESKTLWEISLVDGDRRILILATKNTRMRNYDMTTEDFVEKEARDIVKSYSKKLGLPWVEA